MAKDSSLCKIFNFMTRKISIEHFDRYCKSCKFYEIKSRKHYCHLDKTLKRCLASHRKRIKFDLQNSNDGMCIVVRKEKELNEVKDRTDSFIQGFFDCINDVKKMNNSVKDKKSYIEGYSKAMFLKKN